MTNEVEKYYETSDLCLKISRNNHRKVAIEILEEKIRNAKNHWEIVAIKEHLATEYVLDHRIVDGRRMREELIVLNANSEMSLSGLASHYFYVEENAMKALDILDSAETESFKTGNFRRHIQAQKARIALAISDYSLLSEALEKIVSIFVASGQRDVRKERDFFDPADKAKLDPSLVEKFERYLIE